MLRCREVVELIGSDAARRAPWRTRVGIRLHLMMCRHCTAYARSLRTLADAARRLAVTPEGDEGRRNAALDAVRGAARQHPGSPDIAT